MRKPIFLIFSLLLFGLFRPLDIYAQQTNEQLASHYYSNGEYEQAIELYEALYKRTTNKYYYQMLYRSYMAIQDYKSAERLVERRIKQGVRDLSLYVDLGNINLQQDEKKKADKVFNTAIDKLGYDSRQLSELTMAFENINLPEYSVKAYLHMRKKLGSNLVYIMELATLYQRMGDYEKMMQEYFDLLDNAPGNMGSIQLALQRALNETSNPQLAEGLKQTLIDRIREKPDNRQYLEMMIWFSLQQKDFQFALTQAMAIDARFPDLGGEQILRVSQIAHSNEDYITAIQGYKAIVNKGKEYPYYYDARVGELKAEFDKVNEHYKLENSQINHLKQLYLDAFEELGKNEKTIPLMRDYATLMAYHANEVQIAADILYDILELPRISRSVISEVKLQLGDVLLFAGEIWEASLLYMQVEKANKNDVIGAQAKFRNAKLSYYNNDFTWAKSQLDVLRSSTSKLIANDAMQLSLLISDNMEEDSTYGMLELYAAADLMLYRNQLDSAWNQFDEISHRALSHPLFDDVLLQKAKIRLKQARYNEADTLLNQLIEFYPMDILADDALFIRGMLNEEKLNNIEQARSCYEKLIVDYPTSLYVDRARKHYNKLK